METAKQKAIREAYGEHFEALKSNINQDGIFTGDIDLMNESLRKQSKYSSYIEEGCKKVKWGVQPKSLSGIENNNGWIRIESESDLPKDTGYYHVKYHDGSYTVHRYSVESDFDKTLFLEEFSYYQPIEKPKPPIY